MATISSVKQSKTNVTHLSRRTKATSASNHRPSRWSDIYMGPTSCLIETRQISDRKLLPRSIYNILILVSKDLNSRFVTSSVDRPWQDNCRVRCRHGVSLLFCQSQVISWQEYDSVWTRLYANSQKSGCARPWPDHIDLSKTHFMVTWTPSAAVL